MEKENVCAAMIVRLAPTADPGSHAHKWMHQDLSLLPSLVVPLLLSSSVLFCPPLSSSVLFLRLLQSSVLLCPPLSPLSSSVSVLFCPLLSSSVLLCLVVVVCLLVVHWVWFVVCCPLLSGCRCGCLLVVHWVWLVGCCPLLSGCGWLFV